MNPPAFLHEPFTTALGWALVHFLWQGALIALLLALANAASRRAGARVRYALACGAMALMVLSVAGTFCRLWFELTAEPFASAETIASVPLPGVANVLAAAPAQAVRVPVQFATVLPWLDCLWLAGVLLLSARSIGGWFSAQRLKTWNTTPVDSIWEQRAQRLAQALKVSRPVRISKSALARLPAVVGWFRPVILVPASALAGVDPQQLEALLAHELAHIRRHDYLVNLIQTAAETLLFYHPAVWWVGRRIRIERENCCDDLAVSACGDVLTYARALTRLEELRSGESQYAMAAAGGSLLARIRRLLGPGETAEQNPRTWLAGVLVALTLCAVWAGAHASSLRLSAGSQTEPPSAVVSVSDPAPQEAGPTEVQNTEPAKPARQASSGSFIDDLAAAGYSNLTVDQLIAFKIHEVTPEYITQLREAGMTGLTPDQLIAFRIHGVNARQLKEWKSAGIAQVTPDQAVALRIHDVTPEFVAQMKKLELGEISVDRLIAMKIHNVTPEFAAEMKGLGLAGIGIDQLVAFRIHNVVATQLREMQSLGLGMPSADQAVALRIHEVTPEFVRDLKDAGLTKLSFDELIAARIHGITRDFIQAAIKHGFKNLTLDQLIQLKRMGIQ